MASEPQKIWQKHTAVDHSVEVYTVGHDRELDVLLAPYDVLGSMAHITMLESVGLLDSAELPVLLSELGHIYHLTQKGAFVIEDGVEDVHSQVELMLTRKLGDVGKKIHSGRSRNDQVLLDLKLFMRAEIERLVANTRALFDTLLKKARENAAVIIPGYTHLQVAMPSSIGLWLGAYAESLVDDLTILQAAYTVVNRNPLGSAAGYGSSFPLDRDMTTDLLGFASTVINSVYAQMGRGKTERIVAMAMAQIAATVSKLAFDVCMFSSQNFAFVTLPAQFTTGSSIMPHKKNPDVFELTRAKANRLQALPYEITLITNNLPSGYFRDLQLVKENFLPAFANLNDVLAMTARMIEQMTINANVASDPRYDAMYSVEEVNRLVANGVPFRDAYRQVGREIEAGNFVPDKELHHTHLGSTGNPGFSRIEHLMAQTIAGFDFQTPHRAIENLLTRSK